MASAFQSNAVQTDAFQSVAALTYTLTASAGSYTVNTTAGDGDLTLTYTVPGAGGPAAAMMLMGVG